MFKMVFERGIQETLKLRKGIRMKELNARENYENNRQTYQKNLRELVLAYRGLSSSFGVLEERISQVGHTAVRIGDQLETLDKQTGRAKGIKEIMEIYSALLSNSEVSSLQLLNKSLSLAEGGSGAVVSSSSPSAGGATGGGLPSNHHPERDAALLHKRLYSIAGNIEPGNVKDKLIKLCEQYERTALDEFERFYAKDDFSRMSIWANALFLYNGGHSCLQAYVNQHSFFLDQMKNLPSDNLFLDNGRKIQILVDLMGKADPNLMSLYEEIILTCKGEYQLINSVFPRPIQVYEYFVRRTFEQLVQGYLEVILKFAEDHSTIAYLQTLHTTFEMSHQLMQDLARLFARLTSADEQGSTNLDRISSVVSDLEDSENNSNSQPNKKNQKNEGNSKDTKIIGDSTLGNFSIVSRCLEDVFVPYLEPAKYLERERKAISEINSLVLHFCLVAISASSSSTASSSASNATNNSAAAKKKPATGSIVNVQIPVEAAIYKLSDEGVNLLWIDTPDPLINPKCVETGLLLLGKGIQRMSSLLPSDQLPKSVCDIWNYFLNDGPKKLFETLSNILVAGNPVETEGKAFVNVENVRSLISSIQHFFELNIVPHVSVNQPLLKELIKQKNEWFVQIEQKCNQILQKQIDVIFMFLGSILGKQKKLDYKPKDESMAIMIPCTETCQLSIDYLLKMNRKLKNAFKDSAAYNVIQTEIMVAFHSLLLDHLKKFPVSDMGALLLSKDLGKYFDLIKSMEIQESCGELYEMLKELGNLYLVRPENLQGVMAQGHLSRYSVNSLIKYAMNRSDFKQGSNIEDFMAQSEECLISHPCNIYSTCGTRNFEWILTAGEDGLIRIWDFYSSMLGKNPLTNNQKHGWIDSITKDEAAWLLAGSSHGDIYLTTLRFDQGRIHFVLRGHEATVSKLERLRPDSGGESVHLLSGGWDKRIKLWDLNTGNCIGDFSEHSSQVSALQAHPLSPSVFLSAGIDGHCFIWDKRQKSSSMQNNHPLANASSSEQRKLSPWILTATWSCSGNGVYYGRRNGVVEEWDLRSNKIQRKFKPPNSDIGCVYQVHFHICSVSYDNIRMWPLNQSTDKSGGSGVSNPFYIVPGHQGSSISDILFDREHRFMIESTGNRGWLGNGWKGSLFFDVRKR